MLMNVSFGHISAPNKLSASTRSVVTPANARKDTKETDLSVRMLMSVLAGFINAIAKLLVPIPLEDIPAVVSTAMKAMALSVRISTSAREEFTNVIRKTVFASTLKADTLANAGKALVVMALPATP